MAASKQQQTGDIATSAAVTTNNAGVFDRLSAVQRNDFTEMKEKIELTECTFKPQVSELAATIRLVIQTVLLLILHFCPLL